MHSSNIDSAGAVLSRDKRRCKQEEEQLGSSRNSSARTTFVNSLPAMSTIHKKTTNIKIEGRMGEHLKLRAIHELVQSQESSHDEEDGTPTSVLPAINGLLDLILRVHVDRKKCSNAELEHSGLMHCLVAFFREVGLLPPIFERVYLT